MTQLCGNHRPLRFLFAVNTPWTEELGLPRVSIEISRVVAAAGHHVEHFSTDDIRPHVRGKLRGAFAQPLFQRALRRFVRRNGHRFDVIQSEHDTLIFPRSSYRFDGLLIAKSNGLRHFYEKYVNEIEKPLRDRIGQRGTIAGNLIRGLSQKLAAGISRSAELSFDTADQIHLLNNDELTFVRDKLGHGQKCQLITNGISDDRARELAESAAVESRLRSKTIVFIGTWSLRKGKLELPGVLRRLREADPSIRMKLLGTMAPDDSVVSAFSPEDRGCIENVERFAPAQLPDLLRDARAGVFLSYVEGFGLGVLEMLAAGIPVVAWDAPGVRELLGPASADLFKPGELDAVIRRLLYHLQSSPADYRLHSLSSLNQSKPWRWSESAAQFLRAIEDWMSEHGRRSK